MKREPKEKTFIFYLDKTTRLNLALLAQEAGKSQAEVIRRLINSTAGKMTHVTLAQSEQPQSEPVRQ